MKSFDNRYTGNSILSYLNVLERVKNKYIAIAKVMALLALMAGFVWYVTPSLEFEQGVTGKHYAGDLFVETLAEKYRYLESHIDGSRRYTTENAMFPVIALALTILIGIIYVGVTDVFEKLRKYQVTGPSEVELLEIAPCVAKKIALVFWVALVGMQSALIYCQEPEFFYSGGSVFDYIGAYFPLVLTGTMAVLAGVTNILLDEAIEEQTDSDEE